MWDLCGSLWKFLESLVFTPEDIYRAITDNNLILLRNLIRLGYDVNYRYINHLGEVVYTPLYLSVVCKNTPCLLILLEAGAQLDIVCHLEESETALDFAIFRDDRSIIRLLIYAGSRWRGEDPEKSPVDDNQREFIESVTSSAERLAQLLREIKDDQNFDRLVLLQREALEIIDSFARDEKDEEIVAYYHGDIYSICRSIDEMRIKEHDR